MSATTKSFLLNHVVPEQKKTIDLLTALSNEIQEETRTHKIGSILYSTIGFFGGLAILSAPCTAGSSVAFYGSGAMLFAKIAEFLHGDARENTVQYKLMYANESMYLYSQTCLELFQRMINGDDSIENNIKFLQQFGEQATQSEFNVENVVFFLKSFIRLTPSEFKESIFKKDYIDKLIASVEPLKQSIPFTAPTTVLPMLNVVTFSLKNIDVLYYTQRQLSSLVSNYKVLSDFDKGRKCFEAMRLDYMVRKIRRQFEDYA